MILDVILYSGGIVIALLTLLIYHCVIRQWNFFANRNVKFIRGLPLLGVHYKTWGLPTRNSFKLLYDKFPNERFIGIYDASGKPSYMIRELKLIKEIMINNFECFTNHSTIGTPTADTLLHRTLFNKHGHEWRKMRAQISPAFTGIKLKNMSSLVGVVCKNAIAEMQRDLNGQLKRYDIFDLSRRIVSDSIALCAFGFEINSVADRKNEFFQNVIDLSKFNVKLFFMFGVIPRILNFFRFYLYNPVAVAYFDRIVEDNVKYAVANNEKRNGMIGHYVEEVKGVQKPEKLIKTVSAQSISFIAAGFHSLTVHLHSTLIALSYYPRVQEKLYNEIDSVRRKLRESPLDYDTVNSMDYMNCVVMEMLRMKTVFGVSRTVVQQYVVENTDGDSVILNPGDLLWMPFYPIHMDQKYYPDPDRFNPDRFTKDWEKNDFLSFGLGPRNCVGLRFAIITLKFIVFHLLAEFKFEPTIEVESSDWKDVESGWLELKPR